MERKKEVEEERERIKSILGLKASKLEQKESELSILMKETYLTYEHLD